MRVETVVDSEGAKKFRTPPVKGPKKVDLIIFRAPNSCLSLGSPVDSCFRYVFTSLTWRVQCIILCLLFVVSFVLFYLFLIL